MTRRSRNRIGLAGSFLLMTTPALQAGEFDIVEAVRCTEIAFSHSVESADQDRFAAFLDDDARFVGRGVLRGREEILRGWAVFFGAQGPRLTWRPEFVEVLADGHLALTRGPYLLTATDEAGEQTERWGIFNSVWRLDDDGDWKVVFDAGHEGAGEISDEHRVLLRVASCDIIAGEPAASRGAAVREST